MLDRICLMRLKKVAYQLGEEPHISPARHHNILIATGRFERVHGDANEGFRCTGWTEPVKSVRGVRSVRGWHTRNGNVVPSDRYFGAASLLLVISLILEEGKKFLVVGWPSSEPVREPSVVFVLLFELKCPSDASSGRKQCAQVEPERLGIGADYATTLLNEFAKKELRLAKFSLCSLNHAWIFIGRSNGFSVTRRPSAAVGCTRC